MRIMGFERAPAAREWRAAAHLAAGAHSVSGLFTRDLRSVVRPNRSTRLTSRADQFLHAGGLRQGHIVAEDVRAR